MTSLLLNANRPASSGRNARPIVVGLINNMPDAALRSTERQFCELLVNAAGKLPIVVRFFSLPEISRSADAQSYVRDHYEHIDQLWNADLDGLIVTGTEPRAAELTDEPYWPTLAKLVDWAAEHTVAAMWSCLAAHAVVKHLDGVERHALATKLSGVFECVKAVDHRLVGYGAATWYTPHSRYNEVREEDLVSRGYQILTRSPAAGADTFVKQGGSLFLFLQGHPEYDAGALLREYRRDVRRFLAGEGNGYPEMPCGYLDDTAACALLAFRERAFRERYTALLSEFPTVMAQQNSLVRWREAGAHLYANWLSYLAEAKSLCSESAQPQWTGCAEPKMNPV